MQIAVLNARAREEERERNTKMNEALTGLNLGRSSFPGEQVLAVIQ